MTQEIKDKLEQAADALFEHKGYSFTPCDYAMRKGFLAGAQTILENPEEWGLEAIDPAKVVLAEAYYKMQSQLAKYREALEKFANMKQTELSGYYVRGTKKYAVEEAVKVTKDVLALINHLAKEALKKEEQ